MTASQSLRLYELTLEFIKDKEKAKEYVSKIEETIDAKFLDKEKILATKLDIADTKATLADTKADIIKWMFVFWVGSIVATLGGLITIIRFMIVK